MDIKSYSDVERQCKVVVMPNYYIGDGFGLNSPYILCEDGHDGDEELVFHDADDAQAHIDKINAEVYVASNGEADRPDYIIVPADYEVSYDDANRYDWSDADCECCECYQCLTLMMEQDRARARANAIRV